MVSEDVGECQTVKLPDSGEDGNGELVTDVTKEVGEVRAQQDDSAGEISVIL